jgi:molybdopterin-guanine dinucleotide biosynthesis protein A
MASVSRPSGFVRAGGQSSRMGFDKARLEIDGQPLLLRTLNLLRPYVDSLAVLGSADDYDFIQDPVIRDRQPGRGPLAAILSGLEHLTTEWGIFLACDLPMIDGRFIEFLLRFLSPSESDAVVPRTTAGWQPLCAAYRKTSIHHIRKALDEGEFALFKVLPRLRVDVIESKRLAVAGLSESIFENLNSPEDLERILGLLSARLQ